MTRVLSVTARKQTSLENAEIDCAQSDGLLNMFRCNFMGADYTLNFLSVKIFYIYFCFLSLTHTKRIFLVIFLYPRAY